MAKTFERTEKKYKLNKSQYDQVMSEMLRHLVVDQYGLQEICNLYFDTDNYELIRNSIEKPPYKEKLRLRSYGIPKDNDTVFLELKKKYLGTVYKRRFSASYAAVKDYLAGRDKLKDGQIKREIDYVMNYYAPQPKVFLAYDRIALFCPTDVGFRITFDSNIRYRFDCVDFEHGSGGKRMFDEEYYVMEVKAPLSMPLWLTHLLTNNQLYPTSFSKYGEIYKKQYSYDRVIDKIAQNQFYTTAIEVKNYV